MFLFRDEDGGGVLKETMTELALPHSERGVPVLLAAGHQ
jgi:hypothetical protein